MKRLLKVFCPLLLVAVTILSSIGGVVSSADGSHGFYMDCDTTVTGKKTDGFMIDFYSDSTDSIYTYWSNANWSMYTLETSKQKGYLQMSGGGAYTGLQMRGKPDDRTGILSFWRYEYLDRKTKEKKYLYAEAVYGNTTKYDNEGSGTSCVMPYDWKSSQWYRQLLLCWKDEETGDTFMGTWYYDYEAEEWTLFAYYNTFLVDSYINSGIGQFLENYVESSRDRYRAFRYRNIYMLSHETGEWISSPKVSLRSDGNPKAHGEAKLGVSEDGTYVWASVDGGSEIDTDNQISVNATLKQDKTPTVGSPEMKTLNVLEGAGVATLSWEMTEKSTPQLSYKVVVTDGQGNEIAKKSGTRPEVDTLKIEGLETDNYKCTLTVTDVFGKSVESVYESKNYHLEDASTPSEEEPTKESLTPSHSSGIPEDHEDKENKPHLGAVIGIACGIGAVLVLAVAGTAVVIVKKRKKKGV